RREDDPRGGVRWAVHVVRHGRLAAAGVIPPGPRPHPSVADLAASGESVRGGPGPAPAATAEETERILRWLEAPGLRLIEVDGEWTCPRGRPPRPPPPPAPVPQSGRDLVPFDDRRDLPTTPRRVR